MGVIQAVMRAAVVKEASLALLANPVAHHLLCGLVPNQPVTLSVSGQGTGDLALRDPENHIFNSFLT